MTDNVILSCRESGRVVDSLANIKWARLGYEAPLLSFGEPPPLSCAIPRQRQQLSLVMINESIIWIMDQIIL